MKRETSTFETTNEAKIEFKKDITGREKRSIDAALYEDSNFSISNEDVEDENEIKKDFSMTTLQIYIDEMMKQLIYSVNGKTEDVFEEILNLPAQDADEIALEVQNVYKKLTSYKKKRKNRA